MCIGDGQLVYIGGETLEKLVQLSGYQTYLVLVFSGVATIVSGSFR
jgi:hypothetical protein